MLNTTPRTRAQLHRALGLGAVFGSAALFAVATVLVKLLTTAGMPPATVAFGRFALGTLSLGAWFALTRHSPRPHAWRWVATRALTNLAAVLLFYHAIRWTTVTNANVLNLTYPLFIAILGPLVLGERFGLRQALALGLGGPGIWLVIRPDFAAGLNRGDVLGLACGVVSSISILSLRRARRDDRPDVIVLWVMALGAAVLAPTAVHLRGTTPAHIGLWLAAAACGVGGQLLTTFGYRFLSAIDGAITSTARVMFAATLGVTFLGEPLDSSLVGGIALILLAVTLIARYPAGAPA